MVSLKNIHTSKTMQIVFIGLGTHTINEEAMNLKENKEYTERDIGRGIEGGKGMAKWCNCIIISKNKKNFFKERERGKKRKK